MPASYCTSPSQTDVDKVAAFCFSSSHIWNVLPLSPKVDRAYSEQAEVEKRRVLEVDEERRQQLQRQQSQVSAATAAQADP